MVTRSIVGRFLVLAVLLASVGVIAQAAFKMSQQANTSIAKSSAAPPPRAAVAAAAPTPPTQTAMSPVTPAAPPAGAGTTASPDAGAVRVVYPGPLGDAPVQPRKIPDAAPASPPPAKDAAPVPSAPLQSAAAAQPVAIPPAPQPVPAVRPAPPVEIASTDPGVGLPAAQPTADAPAAGKGGIDLNSASVDALNRLGGGHIGQTIVQHRPYRSVEDLVKRRVVRRSVYEQIKRQLAAQ